MSERGYYTEQYRLWRDPQDGSYVLEDITTGATFRIRPGHLSTVAEMLLRMTNDRWLAEGARIYIAD